MDRAPVNELDRLSRMAGRGMTRAAVVLAIIATLGPTVACDPVEPTPITSSAAASTAPASADLDAALRSALSERLGVNTRLVVRREKMLGAWTFACGKPVTSAGDPVDYTSTTLRDQAAAGLVDDHACTLVERTDAGYVVRELSVGDTDAPFIDWPARHGIPDSIIAAE